MLTHPACRVYLSSHYSENEYNWSLHSTGCANLAINNVCWPPFTLVQHSPDVGLMSLVYITGCPPIGAIIHVGLQLEKHILMLVHCLRGLPNFNPSMRLFFMRKKTLATFTSHITRHITHQLHSVTRIGTRIAKNRWAIVWPALNQHYFNASSWLCLDITGQCWASVRQWWDSDGSLTPYQVPSYIAYCVSPQNIHEAFSQC